MISRQHRWLLSSEILLAWFVLFMLLFYTYLELVAAPYLGFNYNPSNGQISEIYPNSRQAGLEIGDKLVAVDDLYFEEWNQVLRAPLFPNANRGESLALQIQEKGQESIQRVDWAVPGFTWDELNARIRNGWWLGYLFWVFGLATLLFVRPLDAKRRLLAALFLLTALWLTAGNTSRWGHGESRIVYRVALIFSAPVMLHLHWLYPRSLGPLSLATSSLRFRMWVHRLGWIVYGLTTLVALLQCFELIPSDTGILAFAIGLIGSLGLLVVHYVRQPDVRLNIRLLLIALLFAVLPLSVLAFVFTFTVVPPGGSFMLLALPIIPGAYFYSIYRYQLGGSEFRANRLIAVYLYLILLATVIPIATTIMGGQGADDSSVALLNTMAGIVIALITIYGFPPFQRFVERWLLAMPLPPMQLIDTYLERITITLNEASMVQLLRDEVLPSLLIRQSALLRIRNNEATAFYTTGETLPPSVVEGLVDHLHKEAVYRFYASPELPASTWVKTALALQVEGKLIGIWLLGRHDPDDLYSPVEIATLQTLARQTALALANIDQAAQLQALYQANIERQEQESMKMAHLLHDAILNQAAVLYMSLNAATLTQRVEDAYAKLKEQIHQMISTLRPPSLDLGLNAALEELAEELEHRDQSKVVLRLTVATQTIKYQTQIENHIFRIVQQACENAYRHAHAASIQITGTLAPNRVDLTVEDDGIGFVLDKPLNITNLLAHKHFGLVHMVERAEHIGADLELDSAPGEGTRVHLVWSDKEKTGNKGNMAN